MLGDLWELLALTTPEGEDPARAARLLEAIIAAVSGVSLVALAFDLLFSPRPYLRTILVAALVAFAVAHLLTVRRLLRSARLLLMFAVLGVLIAILYTSRSGIHSVTTMMLPAAIVMGSLVLGRRGFLLITALAVLAAAGLVVADIQGFIETPYHAIATYRDAIAPALFLALTAFLVRLLAADLVRSADRATSNERELAGANERLEQQAAALEASEARWRAYIERASDLVFVLEPPGRFAMVNQAVCRTLGYREDELLGRDPLDLLLPESRQPARQALTAIFGGAKVDELSVEALARDGRRVSLEFRGHSIFERGRVARTVHIGRDVTTRKQLEEERRRLEHRVQAAQRAEGLGVLAGGIAHDFNNLLMAIMGNIDIAKEDLTPGMPSWQPLGEAENAARRCTELTRQLLAYSGRAAVLVQPADLSEAVRDMSEMLRVSATERVSLRFQLATNLPLVNVDIAQIRQMLVNLVMNASEAIGEGGGIVNVSTAVVEHTREELATRWLHDELPGGCYVELQVRDDGIGMDQQTAARIFDPFFTTKFTGRGLGLAAVLGIVRSHKGAIVVDSAPGRGSSIRVLLPVLQ
jgi:PAS domain S-box-containing protein